jgi:hypothetical protein
VVLDATLARVDDDSVVAQAEASFMVEDFGNLPPA